MNYEELTYKQLDALWFEKDRERNLATGTPDFHVISSEMDLIRSWMAEKEREWTDAARRFSAQTIAIGMQLPGKCGVCGVGILAASKFCHVCGSAQP